MWKNRVKFLEDIKTWPNLPSPPETNAMSRWKRKLHLEKFKSQDDVKHMEDVKIGYTLVR